MKSRSVCHQNACVILWLDDVVNVRLHSHDIIFKKLTHGTFCWLIYVGPPYNSEPCVTVNVVYRDIVRLWMFYIVTLCDCECSTSWHCATVNVLHRGIVRLWMLYILTDIHLQGHDFLNLKIAKTVGGNVSMTFIEVDIFHRMVTLRKMYSVTLT